MGVAGAGRPAYTPTMASGIDALTDKEKQTLRLLLQGHDAKTMARHLGLSVHTINERLRDARRKLATPSSREAARRLREVEADTPELLGDTGFGAVAVAASGALAGHQPSEAAAGWRPGWTIGGIAMLIALALAALTSDSAIRLGMTGPSRRG